MNKQLESLMAAYAILEQAKTDTCNEPMAVYGKVLRASRYIDAQIAALLAE